MEIRILKPRKALNKAFLKVKPNRTEIKCFKTNLTQLLDRINNNESEEFHKNLVSDFLKETYYKKNHFINTKGRNDLVIHNGDKATSTVGVVIEAKKPTNKNEMLTKDRLNVKAFQELVLYYLRERITHKNIEIKHLIATNINEWFIFDTTVFDRLFAQNKNFVKHFEDFESGRLADTKTDFFYKQIAEPFIAEIKNEIEFTYFDIRDYEKALRNDDKNDDNKLIALFKLLSPEHLLKLPFVNDSNSLDKRFYGELLHLIGLSETKEGSKKIIERNKEGQRNTGSIIENTIIQLNSLDKISRLENPKQFGSNHQERLFNVALELSITWINRILFLKLLEGQLLSYHKGDKSYEFLNSGRIQNYDDLNSLFFQVLARNHDERDEDIKDAFAKVPYLNSSLFEPTEIEHTTLFVSNLRNDKSIPIYSQSVLKDDKGKRLTGELSTIEYLFKFLSAYDFASEGCEEIQEDNKTLINASVLGLIFEKINGYKDGSFFTPGFITMYMCRETIRKAVVQKFNSLNHDLPDSNTNSIGKYESINDIYEAIGRKEFTRKQANEIINSLKICDPAVGSGHFLVSALNELIAIKNELKILDDKNGKSLNRYEIEVVNDELIVTDEDGELFEYNPTSKESQRIQETLFHEKQTIIENCLFGVDINPNSVKICRLRLWIELLKNAYYIQDYNSVQPLHINPVQTLHATSLHKNLELQTLPNIDINIKCGNSLISRFALDADLKQALKKSKWNVFSYHNAVQSYKKSTNKETKRELEKLIQSIKSNYIQTIQQRNPQLQKYYKLKQEFDYKFPDNSLFVNEPEADYGGSIEKREIEKQKLTKEIEKVLAEIEAEKSFFETHHAFEWRFEFPEVLDDNADFVGFDVVIGNPPYITILLGKKQEYNINESNYYKSNYKTFEYKGNTYVLFMELGNNLVKNQGLLNYIIPNTFLLSNTYSQTRQYLLSNQQIIQIVDCEFKVFEEAEIGGTVIFIGEKNKQENKKPFETYHFTKSFFDNNFIETINQSKYAYTVSNKFYLNNKTIDILYKSTLNSTRYGNLVKLYQGIITGDNKKFISNVKENDQYVKILRGRDIGKYSYSFSSNFLLFDKEQLWSNTDEKNFLTEKIISRQTSDCLIAAYDNEKNFTLDSTHVHTLVDNKINLKYLLALFNSKFLNYLYKLMVQEEGRVFAQVKTVVLKELPIRYVSIKKQKPIIELVEQILNYKDKNIDTTDLENQIDQLVYKLYDLTEEEIEIIENRVK